MSGRVELESRENLFGDGGTADNVPPLENEDLEARLRQVRRGDQPIVTGADDDCVV